jgi:hypothetical protein
MIMKRSMLTFIAMALVVMSVAAQPMPAGAAGRPDRAKGGGVLDRVAFSRQSGTYYIGTSTWVALYRMKVGFTSVSAGPVMATFSASTAMQLPGEMLLIAAQMDGVDMAPGGNTFESGTGAGARSYTWAAGNVAPGYHVVRIMAATGSGGFVYIDDPVLTVMHTQ